MQFNLLKKDSKTKARLGIIKTSHGEIKTPSFSPVATKAVVRSLSPEDLIATKSQVILGNTYHLFLQPGVKTIKKFDGFANFMNWKGPTITDSGGYQVSFLWEKGDEGWGKVLKINDNGAWFSSHLDGSKHLLTPEKSMEIQRDLGADIIMAFDQPLGSGYSFEKKKEAFERTLKWEERSLIAWKKLKTDQALFGIIQGDLDKNLRRSSLKFLLDLDFPGLAIGGESIGADPKITSQTLDLVVDLLPDNKPLHALGLGGGPEGIFAAVEKGIDLFDNSSITRLARTGGVFIYPEDGGNSKNKFRIDLRNKIYAQDKKPLSKNCSCYTCQNFSRAYLHHLFISHETLVLRLASLHNIFYINSLMENIRQSIKNNNFSILKKEWGG